MATRTKSLCTTLMPCLLIALAACHQMAPQTANPEPNARLDNLSVQLASRLIDPARPEIRGVVKPRIDTKATSDTLDVTLTISDAWGTVLTKQPGATTGREFRMRVPSFARGAGQPARPYLGPLAVRAEAARAGASPLKGESWAYAGNYQADVALLEKTANAQATLLKKQIAEASAGSARVALERRLAVAEHARAWLARDHAKPNDAQLLELGYLQRDLGAILAGKDPTDGSVGVSHLLAIDFGDAAPTSSTRVMRFWVHLPPNYSQKHDWPLAIFLHGSTSSKDMVETIRSPLAAYPDGVGMPCVSIAPKAEGRGWNIDALNLLLDYMLAHFDVSADRVALLGHSMGGAGTLNWVTRSPERFSAYMPMSASGDPSLAGAYSYLPSWFIHGRKDNVASALGQIHWVRFFGGTPRVTILPQGEHMSVFSEFAKPELWTWLAEQRRQAPPAEKPTLSFDKLGLGPTWIEGTPAGMFYVAPAAGSGPRDRGVQDAPMRDRLERAGADPNGFLIMRTPNASAADATSTTRQGFFVPAPAPKAIEGLEAEAVPAQRVFVRIYRGPAQGLPAALEVTRRSARDAGLKLTGEEWQIPWYARREMRGGRETAILRELRLVAEPPTAGEAAK